MANKMDRLKATELYVSEGKTVKEISAMLGINEKNLYYWCKTDEWDSERETIALTGLSAYKSTLALAVKQIQDMVTSGKVDSSKADALQKIVKAAKSLYKDIDKRGNILLGIGELIEFLRESHPEQLETLQPYLIEFGTYVKKKYP